jgi:hypothetical protein
MKVCPSCNAEFVDSASTCNDCDVDLVAPDQIEAEQTYEDARSQLKDKEVARLSVGGGLAAAREVEKLFHKEGIVCYVDAEEGEAAVMSMAPMTYYIVVAKEDEEQVASALKGSYEEMVAKEGTGPLVTEAVDLEKDEVVCPACGHTGALVDGACGDCGLHLGAPE